MKKLVLILVLIVNSLFAQENSQPLAAYKIDSLWYFIDYNGNHLFEPVELENVKGYSEGLFAVSQKVDGKEVWGYLDLKGKFVIKPQFKKAGLFSDGWGLVLKISNINRFPIAINFVNKHNEFLLEKDVIDALDFSESKTFVMTKERKTFYIDNYGKILFELGENFGGKFSNGFATITNMDYRVGFIDSTGKQICDFKFDNAKQFSQGLAPAYFIDKFGYIDTSFNFVIEPRFDYTHPFIEDRAFVGAADTRSFKKFWGLIDKKGNLISEFKYKSVWDFSEGLAAVRYNDGWGFIDKKGHWFISPTYYFCASFINGLAWVTTKDKEKSGYINKSGEFILEIDKFDKLIDLRLNKRMY